MAMTDFYGPGPFFPEGDPMARGVEAALMDPRGAMYNTGPQMPMANEALFNAPQQPPMPPQGPPQQPPQQQQGSVSGFLNTPGMAMAAQGLENITNLRNNRPTRASPIQAYQSAVASQANQRMKEDLFKRQMDPFWEYEEAQRRGHIPEDMTYEAYQRLKLKGYDSTSNIKNLGQWTELNPQKEGESDEDYAARKAAAFDNILRASSLVNLGGGGVGLVNPLTQTAGGGTDTLVSPEAATARDALSKGAETSASKWAEIDADWDAATGVAVPEINRSLTTVRDMIDYIEANPDMPTGMIQGYVSQNVSPSVSYLQTLSTLMTIPRLAAAKLNPVTEQEFKSIMDTFSSALKDPVANIASLKASYNDLLRIAGELNEQQKYYNENDTLKGYGSRGTEIQALPEPYAPPGKTTLKGPERPGS